MKFKPQIVELDGDLREPITTRIDDSPVEHIIENPTSFDDRTMTVSNEARTEFLKALGMIED